MINYDFIEIGTSCFGTLIEKANDNTVGISIDPIATYLDKLPNKKNVKKICCAVVAEHEPKDLDFFYITEQDIEKHNLGKFMLGCNKLGKPHAFHLEYYYAPKKWDRARKKQKLPNLLSQGLVKKIKVPCYTFGDLVKMNDIGHIKFLRIDTEGHDCVILNDMVNFCQSNNRLDLLPDRIEFETNIHTPIKEIEDTKKTLVSYGYKAVFEDHETVMVKV